MNDVKRMESLVAAFSLKHAGYPFLLSTNMSNRNWICPPIKTRGKKKQRQDKIYERTVFKTLTSGNQG